MVVHMLELVNCHLYRSRYLILNVVGVSANIGIYCVPPFAAFSPLRGCMP